MSTTLDQHHKHNRPQFAANARQNCHSLSSEGGPAIPAITLSTQWMAFPRRPVPPTRPDHMRGRCLLGRRREAPAMLATRSRGTDSRCGKLAWNSGNTIFSHRHLPPCPAYEPQHLRQQHTTFGFASPPSPTHRPVFAVYFHNRTFTIRLSQSGQCLVRRLLRDARPTPQPFRRRPCP